MNGQIRTIFKTVNTSSSMLNKITANDSVLIERLPKDDFTVTQIKTSDFVECISAQF